MRKVRDWQREQFDPVSDDKEVIPYEKWLVAFANKHHYNDSIREFYAQGYYEAYDMVMTYAEKEILDEILSIAIFLIWDGFVHIATGVLAIRILYHVPKTVANLCFVPRIVSMNILD